MGLLYGAYTLSQSFGLVKAYPNATERAALLLSLKQSAGLDVLYGSGVHLDGGIGSYMEWRVLGFGVIFAAIWGVVVASKLLRADEETGRQEHILVGSTTQLKTLRISLGVLTGSMVVQFAIGMALMMTIRTHDDLTFTIMQCALFMITMVSGALLFVAVTTLTSQLFETRQRAMLWAGAVLVVCFGLRGLIATNTHFGWLRFVSPLNWLENIRPLTDLQLQWLAPILGLSAGLIAIATACNHRRDMGAGIARMRNTVRKKSALLTSTLSSSFLFMRTSLLVWGLSVVGAVTFLASLSRTATDAMRQSGGEFQGTLSEILRSQSDAITRIFLGMVFFLGIVLMLTAAASFVGSIRKEESSDLLDMIVVRPRSRQRWLLERVGIIYVTVITTAFVMGLTSWLVVAHDVGLTLGLVLQASLNSVFPVVWLIGVGVLVFALRPRLTGLVMYSIIIGSFLVQIIVPILSPQSGWLRLSLFYYVASVPSTSIQWTSSLVMLASGVACIAVAVPMFASRDLQSE